MKIRAYWKSKNPFNPDISQLVYTKTVEVPNDSNLKVLEKFAIEDTQPGYVFDKIEILN